MIDARRAGVALVTAAWLSGCMVGPNFRQPDAPDVPRYTETAIPDQTVSAPGVGGAQQSFANGAELSAQWWALFRSEPLDQLIRQAIGDSPNLAAAQATLRQARENLAAQSGALLLPRVDANLGATREKITGASLGEPGLGASIFSLYNASVNVSYALDLFGGNRRELEALQSLVDYQNYQLEGAYLALTANIVTTAVREASLRAQLRATADIIDAEQKQLELVEKQYRAGRRFQARGAHAARTGRADAHDGAGARAQPGADPPSARRAGGTFSERGGGDPAIRPRRADVAGRSCRFRFHRRSCASVPTSGPSEALLHQASAQIGVADGRPLSARSLCREASASRRSRCISLFAGPRVWSIGAGLLQPLVPRRRIGGQTARCGRGIRSGAGAIPADGAERFPERCRRAARARRRRADAPGAGARRGLAFAKPSRSYSANIQLGGSSALALFDRSATV